MATHRLPKFTNSGFLKTIAPKPIVDLLGFHQPKSLCSTSVHFIAAPRPPWSGSKAGPLATKRADTRHRHRLVYSVHVRQIGCKVGIRQETENGVMIARREKFGAFIRREREARGIGLREMSKKIGVSPTYLSKVERDEFAPPTEERVRAIARIFERDPDELLALAGRVSSDLADIIKRHPVEVSALLRTAKGLTAEDLAQLAREAQKAKGE